MLNSVLNLFGLSSHKKGLSIDEKFNQVEAKLAGVSPDKDWLALLNCPEFRSVVAQIRVFQVEHPSGSSADKGVRIGLEEQLVPFYEKIMAGLRAYCDDVNISVFDKTQVLNDAAELFPDDLEITTRLDQVNSQVKPS